MKKQEQQLEVTNKIKYDWIAEWPGCSCQNFLFVKQNYLMHLFCFAAQQQQQMMQQQQLRLQMQQQQQQQQQSLQPSNPQLKHLLLNQQVMVRNLQM